jgi:hypothetical protein
VEEQRWQEDTTTVVWQSNNYERSTEKNPYTGNSVGAGVRIHSESYPADYTEGDPDGTELHYNRLQTDDTGRNRFRMRQFLERVGAPLSNRVDLNSLIGLTATVEITHQEYEGEQRAQIARILAP